MPHCPKCGSELSAGAKYCSGCGAQLAGAAPGLGHAPSLSDNLSNSFGYAKKLFSDLRRLVILILLTQLLVLGYAAKALRESPGVDEPPRECDLFEAFVDGVKVVVASFIYMLIPVILIILGVGSFLFAMVKQGVPDFVLRGFTPSQMSFFGGTGLVLVAIGSVIAFVMLIILAAGIAHMIKTGKFGKAFAFGEILGIIGKIGWGKYLGWLILIVIIAVLLGAIAAIPYVGWIIAVIVGPALTVFIFRSLGLLYGQ